MEKNCIYNNIGSKKSSVRNIAAALLYVLVIAMMTASLAACGGGEDEGTAPDDSSAVLAEVGNNVITRNMLDKFAVTAAYMYGYDPASLSDSANSGFLDQLADSYVIYEYYKKQGLEPLDSEYETRETQFIRLVKEQYPDFVKEYDIDDRDLGEFYKSQFLSQTLFAEIQADYSETDMTANAYSYYTSHPDQFASEDGIGTKSFEDALQDVYAQLYAQYYEEKLSDIKKSVSVNKRG